MIYPEKLKSARRDKGLRQIDMANLLSRSKTTIERWERGDTVPTDSEIHIIAKLLEVDISFISDLEEIDFEAAKKKTAKNRKGSAPSFIDRLESPISIHDRILLNGINVEIQDLRKKVREMETTIEPSETISDNLDMFVYKKDMTGRFTYVNPAYLKHLNLRDHLILGKNNLEVFGKYYSKKIDDFEAKAIAGLKIQNEQIEIPGTFGKRYGLLSGSRIYSKDNSIKETAFTISDATEKFEMLENYRMLENAINSSDGILWIKSDKGGYSFISAPIESISGYYINEFMNNSRFWLDNVVDEYDRKKVDEFYRNSENGQSITYKIKTKENEIRDIREKIFFQKDKVFGIIVDISREVERQNEINLFLNIMDELPDIITIIKDYGKKFITPAASMTKLLGSNKKNEEVSNDTIMKYTHPDDKQRSSEFVKYIDSKEWWQSETKQSMHENFKFRVIKNNKVRWLESNIYSTVKYKKQGIRFAIRKDITEKQKQEEEMRHLHECINDMDLMFWAAEITARGTVKYITVSEGVRKIFGVTPKQYMADRSIRTSKIHPEDKKFGDIQNDNLNFPHTSEYKLIVNDQTKWVEERIYKKEKMYFGMIREK